MAKRAKRNRKLQTLPADLSRLAGAPIEAVKARAELAADSAVSTFDEKTGAAFVFSGKDDAPMNSSVSASSDGVTIRLKVSSAPVKLSALEISPGLSVKTTGARRQPVRVTGVKGRVVEVPQGFIWNDSIFQRQGKSFVNAKKFLVGALADPSPAYALGVSSDDVSGAALSSLMGAIDEIGKNGK